jgi:hypothetical protein
MKSIAIRAIFRGEGSRKSARPRRRLNAPSSSYLVSNRQSPSRRGTLGLNRIRRHLVGLRVARRTAAFGRMGRVIDAKSWLVRTSVFTWRLTWAVWGSRRV